MGDLVLISQDYFLRVYKIPAAIASGGLSGCLQSPSGNYEEPSQCNKRKLSNFIIFNFFS